jgi:hypothetical protein
MTAVATFKSPGSSAWIECGTSRYNEMTAKYTPHDVKKRFKIFLPDGKINYE